LEKNGKGGKIIQTLRKIEMKKEKAEKIKFEFSLEDLEGLIDFLLEREIDIAQDIENFWRLKKIFKKMFGREPVGHLK